MQTTHSVGIDLGTTYSSIAYLNERGEPVTLPNEEGELATPSAVLFTDSHAVVGTKALRNAILHPDRVVQNSKRFIGDAKKRWIVNGKPYTPVDIATLILKKLISAGQQQIGPIEQAVITVPAQFGDAQRHATVEAGHRAGLKRVDIINEPVAAALCYVLGSEGIWFNELAERQRILVYDLGGGTFDLSLVMYHKDEVSVIASSGDLYLGGIDWNQALIRHVSDQFQEEFGTHPRTSAEAMQYLNLEAEQAKRSLSVRPKAAMACKHGHRKTYQIDLQLFESLTEDLVEHTADITKRMLKDNKMGWAHVDMVLTTGGASRMPMIRNRMKELSGRTMNTTLSPDLSIAHGATYYAGMLLTNDKFAKSILSKESARRLAALKQRSVNARALGILVRNPQTNERAPHYILPANTPLPADATHTYGTVIPNQKRVHLQIVESGIAEGRPPAKLGSCIIDDLPPDLPEGSEVAVTISYDSEAKVHVSAKDVASGRRAHTEIVRQENVVPQLAADHLDKAELKLLGKDGERVAAQQSAARQRAVKPRSPERPQSKPLARPAAKAQPKPVEQRPAVKPRPAPVPLPATPINPAKLEQADQPVPLCNACGEPLDARGQCARCGESPASRPRRNRRGAATPPPDDAEILELGQTVGRQPHKKSTVNKRVARRPAKKKRKSKPQPKPQQDQGEEEFWQLVDE
ncbi:MAG: Hsp70 family protein [Planctomycetaceae bacterium]